MVPGCSRVPPCSATRPSMAAERAGFGPAYPFGCRFSKAVACQFATPLPVLDSISPYRVSGQGRKPYMDAAPLGPHSIGIPCSSRNPTRIYGVKHEASSATRLQRVGLPDARDLRVSSGVGGSRRSRPSPEWAIRFQGGAGASAGSTSWRRTEGSNPTLVGPAAFEAAVGRQPTSSSGYQPTDSHRDLRRMKPASCC
jgi:hypothetical protein